MRLFHYSIISKLDSKHLVGQWRECIGLLGNGWGKKHSTINYVFKHKESYLVAYTLKVYDEMIKRGYKHQLKLILEALNKRHNKLISLIIKKAGKIKYGRNKVIYPEHNTEYYKECVANLHKKGIDI